MIPPSVFSQVAWVTWALLASLSGTAGWGASPRPTEVSVTLFGQPCLLTGPLPHQSLQLIHSISPERLPVPEGLEQTRKALGAARKISGVPAALDRYREKLIRRLEAQQAFYESFADAKKNKKATLLTEAVKAFQVPAKTKRFQAAFEKLVTEKGWPNLSIEAAAILFGESLDDSPEEEFHRAIQKMGIRYACSFEGDEGDLED